MNVDIQRRMRARGETSLRLSERGFSVLEVLVIVVIVCVVASIGIPMLHSGAKAAFLDADVQSLAEVVKGLTIEGYSANYRASGDGDPRDFLSLQLEATLCIEGNGGYVNPTVNASRGRVILNSSTLPTDPEAAPPAVFITNSPKCQRQVFATLPPSSRQLLAGTIIVAFDAETQTVDVFSVDGHGQASTNVVSIPTGRAQTRASAGRTHA